VGTLTGTANGAMEVVGATNGGDVSGVIMNNFEELRAFADTVATWQAATQNNVKELTTTQGENRLAIIALTDAVKELSAKINTTLTRLRLAGVIIS
jgi:hypothetical protein